MSDYSTYDFIYHRPKPDTEFYEDKMLIFGHTPTITIDRNRPQIYKTKTYINIDCGCVFKGVLGCLELDTMKEYYV